MKLKQSPPPLNLPISGTLIGANEYLGEITDIYLPEQSRTNPVFVIGKKESGRTSLLKSLAASDLEAGKNIFYLTSVSSDLKDVLSRIPAGRYENVIYFSPEISEQHDDLPFGLKKAIEEKKDIFIAIPDETIDSKRSAFLNSLAEKIYLSFLSLDNSGRRADYSIFVDDIRSVFDNYLPDLIINSQKYGLRFVVSAESADSLGLKIKNYALDSGNIVAFFMSEQSASAIENNLRPTYRAYDIANMDDYEACLRLVFCGQLFNPFNIRILPFKQGSPQLADDIIKLSSIKNDFSSDQKS